MDLQLGLFPDDPPTQRPTAVGPAPVDEALAEVRARLPGGLRLGTSSWSFPGWDGIVYDRRASQRVLSQEGLAPYAAHPLLRTVGVDRTYYRPMAAADLRAYADSVPADFRFLVKADRLVTSPQDPEGYGVRRANPLFLDPEYATTEVITPVVEGLGAKAGPILFQFSPIPPNLVGGRAAFLKRLAAFLDDLPDGPLYAIELRTPAFLTEEYAALLLEREVAHCYTIHPAMAPLERQLHVIPPFYQPALVVRWMLHGGLRYEVAKERYEPFNRLVDPDVATRELVAKTVLDAALAEKKAFVIANNKAEGSAPLTLLRLAERVAYWSDGPPSQETPVAS